MNANKIFDITSKFGAYTKAFMAASTVGVMKSIYEANYYQVSRQLIQYPCTNQVSMTLSDQSLTELDDLLQGFKNSTSEYYTILDIQQAEGCHIQLPHKNNCIINAFKSGTIGTISTAFHNNIVRYGENLTVKTTPYQYLCTMLFGGILGITTDEVITNLLKQQHTLMYLGDRCSISFHSGMLASAVAIYANETTNNELYIKQLIHDEITAVYSATLEEQLLY